MGWKVCPTCGTPTDSETPRDRNAKPVLLIADADRAVRSAVAVMVDADYDVVEVEDGPAALQAMHRAKPDAALIAVDLPELDGYAVTRELRARPVTTNLPVVLMTDSGDVDTAEGVRAGADDHVAKPLDADVLLACLDAVRSRLVT
jgi:DNA-binding response OmpR family regulator